MDEQTLPQDPFPSVKAPRWTSGPAMGLYALLLTVVCLASALSATGVAAAIAPDDAGTQLLWRNILWAVALLAGFAAAVCLMLGIARWMAYSIILPRAHAILDQIELLNQRVDILGDRVLVSEQAKRVANRHVDRQALRAAINEDLEQRDFDSALALIKLMSEVYGCHEEAEQLREQAMQAQEADAGRKVDAAIARLDALLKQYAWDRAYAEVGRVQRMFPDSPRVARLDERVKKAYDARKHDLEREFLQAAQRDDVDLAMELLRELDRYLSEDEAEPFRETARGVIGKKRDNLGVQFKLAVQDREWRRALDVGQQIIAEFPNTKMALEVRDMLDLLRQRVAEQQQAAAGDRA